MVRLLLPLLLLASTASAEMGYSLIGACHADKNCEGLRSLWRGKEVMVFGWLETSFGVRCPCVQRLLASPKQKIIRVHVMNGPCLRNRRCGPYEPFAGHSVATADRAVRRGRGVLARYEAALMRTAERVRAANNVAACYVSPCLECDLSKRARVKLLKLAARVLPECALVDNPLRDSCLKNTVCEKHNLSPQVEAPCIVDLDGFDGRAINPRAWAQVYNQCDLKFYWEPSFNCINGSFQDPRQRACRFPAGDYKQIRKRT